MLFPEHFNSRSQDLPKVYHDAGQFFWAKPKIWQNSTKGFDQNNTIVEIPANRVQDIDTHEDWKKAELIYKTISKFKF
jgi:pseudaminic acid cytidylyltransferase